MSLVKAYHASPSLFDKLMCTTNGVHAGSKWSARQAVERKSIDGFYYLYEIEIDTVNFVEEFDHGYYWRSIFEREPLCINGYIYRNEYEPSVGLSYVSWIPEETMRILSVELIKI